MPPLKFEREGPKPLYYLYYLYFRVTLERNVVIDVGLNRLNFRSSFGLLFSFSLFLAIPTGAVATTCSFNSFDHRLDIRTFVVLGSLDGVDDVGTQLLNCLFVVLTIQVHAVDVLLIQFRDRNTFRHHTDQTDILGEEFHVVFARLHPHSNLELSHFTQKLAYAVLGEEFVFVDDASSYSQFVQHGVLSERPFAVRVLHFLDGERTANNLSLLTRQSKVAVVQDTKRRLVAVTGQVQALVYLDLREVHSDRDLLHIALRPALQTYRLASLLVQSILEVSVRIFLDDLDFIFGSASEHNLCIVLLLLAEVDDAGDITRDRTCFSGSSSSFHDVVVQSIPIDFLADAAVAGLSVGSYVQFKSHFISPI
ncbi:hypothetical protein BN405_2-10_Ab1_orf_102 [Pseudomonas phage vB_PaeM_C2-10_Ab1]|uniref:Uncharacterized protein n=1 Tax=Pseudomonas phage vB_PaeM_C2-10_Ab1 TaxID=1231048 RepID=K4RLG8_9CAUD|nr:hypothetical protein BN405_2-10_Ab1_orf_102 [Pseudomonas phage vB_PaeM_C2-10_Ab1]CCM43646.1 hypothetical protein BN405_2-10_Ab1_orf_102 [Pseudomonas phage vB_PaeM_C2-10_Ab1]